MAPKSSRDCVVRILVVQKNAQPYALTIPTSANASRKIAAQMSLDTLRSYTSLKNRSKFKDWFCEVGFPFELQDSSLVSASAVGSKQKPINILPSP